MPPQRWTHVLYELAMLRCNFLWLEDDFHKVDAIHHWARWQMFHQIHPHAVPLPDPKRPNDWYYGLDAAEVVIHMRVHGTPPVQLIEVLKFTPYLPVSG